MRTNNLAAQVRDVVIEVLELLPEELQGDADLLTDLGADSIKILEVIVALEKRLDIHYPPPEVQTLRRVSELVRLTEKYASPVV
jgi:acyl carrier protein